MSDFRRLLGLLRPHRAALALAAGALTGVSAATVGLAALLRPLFDHALSRQHTGPHFWSLPMALVGLYLLKGALSFAAAYLLTCTAHRVVSAVRLQAFVALQRQGAESLGGHSSGGLVSRLTADAETLHATLGEHLASLCRDSLVVAGLMAWIFYLDPWLALLSLCVLPAVVFPTLRIGRRLRRIARSSRERLAELATRVQESIAGARVVRAYGLQGKLEGGFREADAALLREREEAAKWLALASPFMELLGGVAAALVFVASAHSVAMGTMSGGALLSFLTALFLQYTPIKRLSHVHSQVQQGLAAAGRLFEIMDAPGEEALWPGRKRLGRARGAIELRGVRVLRRGRAILDGVDLRLAAGERVAISGVSGAGKTTLLSLLVGFVHPDAGEIRLDGTAISEIALGDLRSQIAIVAQETVLFSGTLVDNVRCARPGASDREVRQALEAAQLGDLVALLPDGLRTRLAEGGVPLSSGERQRVAIARALLKDAPIVLLDEPSSALDGATERRLHAALLGLIRGRTLLIVTHRHAGLGFAERCVELRRGKLVERPDLAESARWVGAEGPVPELATVPAAASVAPVATRLSSGQAGG